ncbi:MAG TPA: amidase [Solirubrobacteraceae bacterium]|nr:amidase [Solirubrobacteraceae bacterium]
MSLLLRPADELAGLVRAGEITARELVQESLDRIEQLNPQLNCFVDVFAEEALAAADAVKPGDPRPLAGVPIAIKNNVPMAGKRLTFASNFFGDFVAPMDANVVQRLRDAGGAIVVGTTTLPEYGIQPVTETRRFGATRNPWALDRTPGGSSGGSAAAVASGMVALAHANDGGGSIRIPAACCGLVGLKAQRGRVSQAPTVGEQFLSIDGVVTRSVRETALAMDLLSGPVLGDASWAPPPAEPYVDAALREPGKLRFGLCLTPPLPDVEATPAHAAAARETAALLESLGHTVEEIDPPMRDKELARIFTAVFGPMVCAQAMLASMMAGGREPTIDDVEALTLWLWETCKGIDAVTAYGALVQTQGAARAIVQWSDPYDAVITPTLAEAPLTIGTLDPDGPDPAATFARAAAFTPYTPGFNMSGQPAISVPVAHDDELGTPIGIQLIGRPNSEGLLLAIASQLEQARPWVDRRPELAGALS